MTSDLIRMYIKLAIPDCWEYWRSMGLPDDTAEVWALSRVSPPTNPDDYERFTDDLRAEFTHPDGRCRQATDLAP